jgi:carbonic anhydrase/acetyltransferase-like protein (isoleucine patch superfamily)
MPIYALGDLVPSIDPSAYVHPDAVVIGRVTIGPESTVWPCAVLRGDESGIVIGASTSIQDGCVLHNTTELQTVVGNHCVIGHIVHLEGCTIEDEALVGNGAVVMHRVVVGRGATVGANAVLTNDTVVPPKALAVGIPAVIKEGRSNVEWIAAGAASYVRRGRQYAAGLRRLD